MDEIELFNLVNNVPMGSPDQDGKLIGVEVFRASNRFRDIIKLMEKRLQAA